MRAPAFETRLLALAQRAGEMSGLVLAWPHSETVISSDPSAPASASAPMRLRLARARTEARDLAAPVIHALGDAGHGWYAFCDARTGDRPILMVHAGGDAPRSDRVWLVAETVFDSLSERAAARTASASVRRLETILSGIESMAQIGIWQVDLSTGTVTWSDEAYRVHGREPGSPTPGLEGVIEYFPEEVRGLVRNSIDQAVEERSSFSFVLPFRRADGELRTVRCIGEIVRAEGLGDTLCGIIQDVTEQREAQLRLWWSANHDSLTGLPNRSLWQDRLDQALELARSEGQSVGLILADLDNFKAINDVYGHEAGDVVLKSVAERLSAHTRQGDTLARLGGDEFAIIVNDLKSPGDLDKPLQRLVTAADVDVDYRGSRIPVKLSLGAAVFPRDAENDRELYRNADLALFRSKAEPQRRGTLYSPRYGEEQAGRESRVHRIRSAIYEESITPCYQPIVDLSTGRILCFEALARWRDGDRLVEVSSFPAAFEDAELAPLLGVGLVKQMAADWRRMREAFGRVTGLCVNASPSQLQNLSFVDALNGLLEDGVLSGGELVLEVKQDPFATLGRHVRPAFKRLLERGVAISFDSLVMGFSALVEPDAVEVRQIKVDCRAVVGDEDGSGPALARPVLCGMIETCRAKGIQLIACGIETAQELEDVRAMGFRLGQGFHIREPVPFETAIEDLARGPVLTRDRVEPS